MKIDFTNEQYQALVKLVYLGEFMINGIRPPAEQIEEFTDVKQLILSSAKDFASEKMVTETSNAHIELTQEQEDILSQHIESYDDESFWEELILRLARKDMVSQYSEEELRKMKHEEIMEREALLMDKYGDEIDQNGLLNIGINKE